MRYSIISLMTSTLFIISCGGGESSNIGKNQVSNTVNSAPVIENMIKIKDKSSNGIIETLEPFTILVKVTDADGDAVTGTATIDDNIVELTKYTEQGDFSHTAEFVIDTKGDRELSLVISDVKGNEVTSNHQISIVPNTSEVQTVLLAEVPNFVVGGAFNGKSILGSSKDENDRLVGYISGALTESQIAFNAAPAGECGANTPQKLLGVDVTTTDVNIPNKGLVFPLECMSGSQTEKLNIISESRADLTNEIGTEVGYVAQSFVINRDSEEGVTVSQTGSGVRIEGVVKDIRCENFVLTFNENEYRVSNDQMISALDVLTESSKNFTLNCHRTVEYNGVVEQSPLFATVTGTLNEIDSTSPSGSIDNITFSVPYQNGGLDQGEICAITTAIDNSESYSEILTLHASDGLVEDVVMDFNEAENKYCTSLIGFDGKVHITQRIADFANNELINSTQSYPIKRNEAPVFSETIKDNMSLKVNQGIVTLITSTDVTDPENHEVTLAGDTSINTDQAPGNYNITVVASDTYNAKKSKTISVELTDNTAPIAKMELTGDYAMVGSKIRDINEVTVLTLSSSDIDGHVVSSSLKSRLNEGSYSEITNYSSTYKHDIRSEGNKTRVFNYQVVDNNGLESDVVSLTLDVHLNTAPTYLGKQSYTPQRGECITVLQAAKDNESDSIFYEIEGNNWRFCYDTPGVRAKSVTLTDEYQAQNIISINIDVRDCDTNQSWTGSECFTGDRTPDPFVFTSFYPGDGYTQSRSVTIRGIDDNVDISVENGTYEINSSGNYTASSGKIDNGDTVRIRTDDNDDGKYFKLTVGTYTFSMIIIDPGV